MSVILQSFFREEREELQRKRMRVRLVQQRKITDVTSIAKEVPDVIPLPAVIGTKSHCTSKVSSRWYFYWKS